MKTLVLYYSRTGTTRMVADAIAKRLKADIEELTDKKDRSGVLGYIFGGRDALRRTLTEIGEVRHDPKGYDLVIVGTPTWAGTMAPAVRTFLEQNKDSFKQVAFFCTRGSSKEQSAMKDMEALLEHAPKAKIGMSTKEVRSGVMSDRLVAFFEKLR